MRPKPCLRVRGRATSRPEILDRGSRGRNRRERFALVWAGSRMERLQIRPRQLELKNEKAPLFGWWRACWDNNPAFQRICGDGQAKLDCRTPRCHLRATQNKWTKLEENCEGLRR